MGGSLRVELSDFASVAQAKKIRASDRVKVLRRDDYTCQICGGSPALTPGLSLHVDHIVPASKGGAYEIDNYQTLCGPCNQGKGNTEGLDRTIADQIDILLRKVNEEILDALSSHRTARVVANDTDFQRLVELNKMCDRYDIEVLSNTIIGYRAMHSAGIYTVEDYYGAKVNFVITER